jgi:tetratricopeptide (TPR) repeat protein
MARHCAQAGRTAQAIGHYQQAGVRAAERYAHAEAINHFQHAVELLHTLPDSRARNQQEVQLQLEFGTSLLSAKGPADPDIERVFGRARALCQEIDDAADQFRAVIGLERFYWTRGELETAYDLAEHALALAKQTGVASHLQAAHTALGMTLANQGVVPRAIEHLEEAIRLDDSSERRSLDSAQSRIFYARTLFVLGYPDRARRISREAVELASEAAPVSHASALVVSTTLHYRMRERDQTRERADEAIAIAHEVGLPFPMALATAYRGWALGGPSGLEEVQRGVAHFAKIGAESSVPHHLLAQVYWELGRTEDALAELEAAFGSRSETRVYDAELHRMKGEVFRQRDELEEATRCFTRALEISREQSTKSLELRAALSFSRLLREQGRCNEARVLLQPIYGWFTEGFDTQDLKDAKSLLEELA